MSDVSNRGGYACMHTSQFCCKTKTALKNKILKKKKSAGDSPLLTGDEGIQIPKERAPRPGGTPKAADLPRTDFTLSAVFGPCTLMFQGTREFFFVILDAGKQRESESNVC